MAKHKIQPVAALTDFAAQEEQLFKHWYESGIVAKYLHKNDQAKKRFSFLDGPITANNPMGVHHGWGRTYKDLWQRYYNLKGYKQRFQNGFDCQGLWVEVEVEKELGFKTKKDIERYGVAKFVQKCKDRVLKYAAIQTEQSKRLGYFMDWDNSYYTMSDANNYMIWHFLAVCHQNGWIYKGKDSVPWCPRCETAISQHEMLTEDYREVTHESVYLALPLVDKPDQYLLVWTTTPWTIPANIAVAVDPKLKYALVAHRGKNYWIAQAALLRLFPKMAKVVRVVSGRKLAGLKYTGPFDNLPAVSQVASHDRFHSVVATDPRILPISTDEGTGLVHTAVSAGSEDFKLGQKLGLPMIPVIADNADYLPGLGFLSGQNAKTNPEVVISYLKTGNWLLKTENYLHRYPACWRCKTELVWKVTDEWYIAMDRPSRQASAGKSGDLTLRQRMIKIAKKISWIPEFGLDRELDWLKNMHDWLISKKNRYWGLCLPIWECAQCGHFEVIGSREELKAKAIAGWDEFEGKSPHKPQLDQVKIKCSHCGALVSRIEPVGNPWLDAGIIPFSTGQWYPADFITESFPGQFKNWFYSLIAMATVLEDTPPFRTVLGFASLLAEDGRPMHKSWGNAIEFNQGADKIGVDIMRWLYCRQNPSQNLLFGFTAAAQVKRSFHLLLWNSYRFFANYAALDQWQPGGQTPTPSPLDRWILSRLYHTVTATAKFLDAFTAAPATQALEAFVADLSTWYIRRSRDRLGPIVYATLDTVLTNLAVVLSPFMPFMTDAIYTNLTGQSSVHLSSWPALPAAYGNKALERHMNTLRRLVEIGHSQRKSLGLPLRQPLAGVTISGASLPADLIYLLAEELNVKQVHFGSATGEVAVTLDVKLTPQLQAEGQARAIIRQIQQARKLAGTRLDEWVDVEVPEFPAAFADLIKRQTLTRNLTYGQSLLIHRHV
jgi:isoleucyl-tRNA synthetase